MANRNEKQPGNVSGAFYVDLTCIDCDLCRQTAPKTFRRDDEIGFSIAFRQPKDQFEFQEARDAMEGCPTSSIGDDGEPL